MLTMKRLKSEPLIFLTAFLQKHHFAHLQRLQGSENRVGQIVHPVTAKLALGSIHFELNPPSLVNPYKTKTECGCISLFWSRDSVVGLVIGCETNKRRVIFRLPSGARSCPVVRSVPTNSGPHHFPYSLSTVDFFSIGLRNWPLISTNDWSCVSLTPCVFKMCVGKNLLLALLS
jgi:hypothetical protein